MSKQKDFESMISNVLLGSEPPPKPKFKHTRKNKFRDGAKKRIEQYNKRLTIIFAKEIKKEEERRVMRQVD